ncbi:MAG: hypothetical protein V4721_19035 [Bacteroidota bacterium]
MLITKYLPAYHFSELHSIEIEGTGSCIYEQMLRSDISKSFIIRILLRAIPGGVRSIENLTDLGFIKLAEVQGEEILFGVVTESPMFNSCQSSFSSNQILYDQGKSVIKAVINFKLQTQDYKHHVLTTETRVWCGSKELKSKFQLYWYFIRPFSQLIRKSILKQIKLQVIAVNQLN